MQTASRLCLAIAIFIGAIAAYSELTAREEPPFGQAITIHDAERELSILPVGHNPIYFRFSNASSQPLRIIGCNPACGLRACFNLTLIEPISIPAHGHFDLECEIDIRSPGEFSCPCEIFLEDGGIRKVKLSVRGIGVAPEGPPRASEKP